MIQEPAVIQEIVPDATVTTPGGTSIRPAVPVLVEETALDRLKPSSKPAHGKRHEVHRLGPPADIE